MSWLEQDLDFNETHWDELEWRLEFVFDHPATENVLELRDVVTTREECMALIKSGNDKKWADLEDLWELSNILDEEENAPFYKKLIEEWFKSL